MIMLEILAFIICIIPTLFEAVMDNRQIRNKGVDKRKGNDMIWRAGLFILVGIIQSLITDKTWWQGAILSFGIFVMCFDYIMAVSLKKPFHFLGTTSRIDRFLRDLPWFGVALFRGILFASALTTYYDLHKVLYGNF